MRIFSSLKLLKPELGGKEMSSVLVGSCDNKTVSTLAAAFNSIKRFDHLTTWDGLVSAVRLHRHDFAFVDLRLAGSESRLRIQKLVSLAPSLQIIVMAEQSQFRQVLLAIKDGARDYVTFPVAVEEVKLVTANADETVKLESELSFLRDESWQSDGQEEVRSDSPAMQAIYRKVHSVAPTKSTVLLSGGTGTGKGVLARAIHMNSSRRDKQFIAVHCGAIPDTLLESDLFGHERGAFSGATQRKLGKFEIAEGGTLFLDEIGTISHTAQIKLLQILQERFFYRLGGEQRIKNDTRIIAATNVDLKQLCDQGLFRSDLYYRLNVFPLELPLLKERKEDIPYLANSFISQFSKFYVKEINGIHATVLDAFSRYEWPGNIRELENLIERAFVLETSDVLTPDSFPQELFENQSEAPQISIDLDRPLAELRADWAREGEAVYLSQLLTLTKGRIAPAAARAGITTRQLHKLMTRHGLQKENYKIPKQK
jgi:DNA-binding NtrC family response regulator